MCKKNGWKIKNLLIIAGIIYKEIKKSIVKINCLIYNVFWLNVEVEFYGKDF